MTVALETLLKLEAIEELLKQCRMNLFVSVVNERSIRRKMEVLSSTIEQLPFDSDGITLQSADASVRDIAVAYYEQLIRDLADVGIYRLVAIENGRRLKREFDLLMAEQ